MEKRELLDEFFKTYLEEMQRIANSNSSRALHLIYEKMNGEDTTNETNKLLIELTTFLKDTSAVVSIYYTTLKETGLFTEKDKKDFEEFKKEQDKAKDIIFNI
jgi:S-methylmethionine-dependent homocysteine/selenocysteine methylase